MSVSKRLRFEILKRDGNKCRYCGASSEESPLTIDHVVPVALGGTDDPSNLVAACKDCNAGKSSSNPDAPLVGQVSEDALRWARAQAVAAADLVADLERRDALRAEFKAAWDVWTNSSKPMPLPATWPESVDRFMQAGLPMRVLLDCVDKAMRRDRIPNGDLFRYTCGIAWSVVTELRNATASALGSAPAAPATAARKSPEARAFEYLIGHLHRLEDLWDPQRVRQVAAEFDFFHGDDEEEDGSTTDYSDWSPGTKAAMRLLEEQLCIEQDWGQRVTYLISDDLGCDYREVMSLARQALRECGLEDPDPAQLDLTGLRIAIARAKYAPSSPSVEA